MAQLATVLCVAKHGWGIAAGIPMRGDRGPSVGDALCLSAGVALHNQTSNDTGIAGQWNWCWGLAVARPRRSSEQWVFDDGGAGS